MSVKGITKRPTGVPYQQIPRGLWDADLSAAAIVLLGWLHSHTGWHATKISQAMIRRQFGGGTSDRALRELEGAGLLRVVRHGAGISADVVLDSDAYWGLVRGEQPGPDRATCGDDEPGPDRARCDEGEPSPTRDPHLARNGPGTWPGMVQAPGPEWSSEVNHEVDQLEDYENTEARECAREDDPGPWDDLEEEPDLNAEPWDDEPPSSVVDIVPDDEVEILDEPGTALALPIDNHPATPDRTPKLNKRGETAEFVEFYTAYPRKEARPRAWAAYKRARTHTDHATIMHGLAVWRETWEARQERQFIPHPATWLNGAKWDDLDAARALREPERGRRQTVMEATMTDRPDPASQALIESWRQLDARTDAARAAIGMPPLRPKPEPIHPDPEAASIMKRMP